MQILNLYLNQTIQIMSNQWCGTREQQIARQSCAFGLSMSTAWENVDKKHGAKLQIVIVDYARSKLYTTEPNSFPPFKGTCIVGFIHLKTIYWMTIEIFSRSIGHFQSTRD